MAFPTMTIRAIAVRQIWHCGVRRPCFRVGSEFPKLPCRRPLYLPGPRAAVVGTRFHTNRRGRAFTHTLQGKV
jgi:hypothetical protein